jgi:hypothetical protein
MVSAKTFGALGIKDDKGVIEFCNYCIVNLGLEAVYVYLAEAFKAKPTYAKAKALADGFLTHGTQTEVNHNNDAKFPLPNNKGLASALSRLQTLTANLAKAKTEPEQITVVEWAIAQPGFTAPSAMFDEVTFAVASSMGDPYARFKGLKPTDLAALLTKGVGAPDAAKKFVPGTWEPLRKKLETAGFDVKAFALPGIK